MPDISYWRGVTPLLLAVAASWWVQWRSDRLDLQPPRLLALCRNPARAEWPSNEVDRRIRRSVVFLALSLAFYLGVFQPLAFFGQGLEVELDGIATWQLFWLHGVFVGLLAVWYVLGFGGVRSSLWLRQLGLATDRFRQELLLGIAFCVGAWLLVIVLLIAVSLALMAVGAETLLPQRAPPMIVWIASLSWPVRLLVSLSAGVVEESFFRGFLQPRIGILGSSALFVMAHLSYDQPFLLVGVIALSLGFAWLTRWRRSIWAAVVGHAVFDAIQLLILIPWILGQSEALGIG